MLYAQEIVCKNRFHILFLTSQDSEGSQNWNDFYVGYTSIDDADSQCNTDFMAVVANVNPQLLPADDTGI